MEGVIRPVSYFKPFGYKPTENKFKSIEEAETSASAKMFTLVPDID